MKTFIEKAKQYIKEIWQIIFEGEDAIRQGRSATELKKKQYQFTFEDKHIDQHVYYGDVITKVKKFLDVEKEIQDRDEATKMCGTVRRLAVRAIPVLSHFKESVTLLTLIKYLTDAPLKKDTAKYRQFIRDKFVDYIWLCGSMSFVKGHKDWTVARLISAQLGRFGKTIQDIPLEELIKAYEEGIRYSLRYPIMMDAEFQSYMVDTFGFKESIIDYDPKEMKDTFHTEEEKEQFISEQKISYEEELLDTFSKISQ